MFGVMAVLVVIITVITFGAPLATVRERILK
jgi:hypothetical protein